MIHNPPLTYYVPIFTFLLSSWLEELKDQMSLPKAHHSYSVCSGLISFLSRKIKPIAIQSTERLTTITNPISILMIFNPPILIICSFLIMT